VVDPSVEGPGLLLVVLDMTGIFVFALSGGLVGVRKGLDIFGVLVLAAATGLGGGFIRDVLIGAVPPAALVDWKYLLVPVAAGLVSFWFHPALGRMERLVTIFDAAGLGLFCVVGALKALDHRLGPVPAALMGTLTAVGGGVVRDLLAGRGRFDAGAADLDLRDPCGRVRHGLAAARCGPGLARAPPRGAGQHLSRPTPRHTR
jgi:uncharacterized membrane protein YeiH